MSGDCQERKLCDYTTVRKGLSGEDTLYCTAVMSQYCKSLIRVSASLLGQGKCTLRGQLLGQERYTAIRLANMQLMNKENCTTFRDQGNRTMVLSWK
jgi:hypothetical protein